MMQPDAKIKERATVLLQVLLPASSAELVPINWLTVSFGIPVGVRVANRFFSIETTRIKLFLIQKFMLPKRVMVAGDKRMYK
jgi:hypothetical protein